MVPATSLLRTVDKDPLLTGHNAVTGILGRDGLLNNGFAAGGPRLAKSTKAMIFWF